MTKDKQQITFSAFDKLDLKAFAENLFQLMEKGLASSIDEIGEKRGLTISLNALFGNGKTTFLKMFENFVKNEKEDYDVLFINAWESDFSTEPVIAILSELASWIGQKNKPKKVKKENQAQGQNTIYEDITKIIGRIANRRITKAMILQPNFFGIGLDLKELKNICTQNDDLLEKLGESIIKEFNQRKTAIQEVKGSISKYMAINPKKPKKLLIIVDELDRTRPDYAVRFLEDIKHFFDIENVVFLVAVNRRQMEATVKCLYGQALDFDGYYRKFFKLEMDMPDIYEALWAFITNLIKKTEVKVNQKNTVLLPEHLYCCSCKMFNLTLREMENLARIFEMILRHKKSISTYIDFYFFFICLFLKEKEIFKRVLDKKFALGNFFQFVSEKKSFAFEKKSGPYSIPERDTLLGSVACSFIQLKPNDSIKTKTLQEYKDRIVKSFPASSSIIDGVISSIEKSYSQSKYDQLAFQICEKIQTCQSALDSEK